MGIESDISSILHGDPTLLHKDIDVLTEADITKFVPKTKYNMCYICAAILFDDNGDVLLIQEAKVSCRGTWYLPAGRLEPGETLIDGTKREVKEEAGLECELKALIGVEILSHTWMRFTFTGKVTGGKLKTLKEQDEESMQAKYFSKEELLASSTNIRHNDIYRLIELGRKFWATDLSGNSLHTLPAIVPHKHLIHRVIIIDHSNNSEKTKMHVLVNLKNGPHIPTALINHGREASIALSVYAIIRDAFTKNPSSASIRMCGILGVEHRGTGEQEDGICITSLVSLDLSDGIEPPSVTSSNYKWCLINEIDLQKKLSDGAKGKIIPLL
ncbi:8-oxo-dGDP phosphatase NUDT18-like [Physella acuta]|uniref:8-oxo-dGDP phosphatase NUDT18-like n=1 Tax=Physella acuta TaxID=109671 RepID=UPI0027DC0E91|nr:8-oxo-dGDP phosphatase NUDT18-like [Physella acuta]